MINAVLVVLASVCLLIYYVSKRKFDYWEKRNIPYMKPAPFLGNYGDYLRRKKCLGLTVHSICEKFPNVPYFGAFYGTEPTLIVQDPETLKLIMTKDYYYFNSREVANYTHKEVVTQNMFFTYGDRWKVLRQNLSPLFSSGKMKNMFYLIEKCSHSFEDMLDREYKITDTHEIRALIARYTMDSIGTCVFGVHTGTMDEHAEKNPFTIIGNLIFEDSFYRGYKFIARAVWPSLFYGIGMKCFPTESDKFFHNMMTEVFAKRDYKPTNRNDFVDLLLTLKQNNYIVGDSLNTMKGDNKKVELKVDDDLLVAQCVLLFIAGYETSATTLQYTLYELAKHKKAQSRAIEEVDAYLKRHNNKLEYECITELPFIEACIDEAMRLYPALPVLTREVTEDYKLPCGAVINKEVRVHIPVYSMHHNPEYFPDPEQFRPERFLGEEKQNIRPYTYMPFGDGPRICMGLRFAKMQMFAGVITLLKKYRLELADDISRKIDFTPTTMMLRPLKMLNLKLVEREGWEQRQLA